MKSALIGEFGIKTSHLVGGKIPMRKTRLVYYEYK